MDKLNCWEIKGCGRETAGINSNDLGVCPAAVDSSSDGLNNGINGGRICWAVAGTFCGGIVQGRFAQKKVSCMSCEVFKTVKKEEGTDFTLLKSTEAFKSLM